MSQRSIEGGVGGGAAATATAAEGVGRGGGAGAGAGAGGPQTAIQGSPAQLSVSILYFYNMHFFNNHKVYFEVVFKWSLY